VKLGVIVGVSVAVGDFVGVSVLVGKLVGVKVGVSVMVAVGDGVAAAWQAASNINEIDTKTLDRIQADFFILASRFFMRFDG
jgi:hypothetical protein